MKRIFLVLFMIVFNSSCTKDNEDDLKSDLDGKWSLTNVSCFCWFGENPDFSGHKIMFDGSILKVENSGELEFLTNAAGAYSLQGNVITLINGQQYTYIVKLDVLELTFVDEPGIADDEVFMEYRRG